MISLQGATQLLEWNKLTDSLGNIIIIDSVHNLSKFVHYIRKIEMFGFYDTIDYLLCNIREDASVSVLVGFLRLTFIPYAHGLIPNWFVARDRIVSILNNRIDELEGASVDSKRRSNRAIIRSCE